MEGLLRSRQKKINQKSKRCSNREQFCSRSIYTYVLYIITNRYIRTFIHIYICTVRFIYLFLLCFCVHTLFSLYKFSRCTHFLRFYTCLRQCQELATCASKANKNKSKTNKTKPYMNSNTISRMLNEKEVMYDMYTQFVTGIQKMKSRSFF